VRLAWLSFAAGDKTADSSRDSAALRNDNYFGIFRTAPFPSAKNYEVRAILG
jgi:hypothetical protein